MHANIPSVNSLQSVYFALERPIMYAELRKLQKKHGRDKFPLIDQSAFEREMLLGLRSLSSVFAPSVLSESSRNDHHSGCVRVRLCVIDVTS